MKVYLLEVEYFYEGTCLIGVYATRELANTWIEENPAKGDEYYTITEKTVIGA